MEVNISEETLKNILLDHLQLFRESDWWRGWRGVSVNSNPRPGESAGQSVEEELRQSQPGQSPVCPGGGGGRGSMCQGGGGGRGRQEEEQQEPHGGLSLSPQQRDLS